MPGLPRPATTARPPLRSQRQPFNSFLSPSGPSRQESPGLLSNAGVGSRLEPHAHPARRARFLAGPGVGLSLRPSPARAWHLKRLHLFREPRTGPKILAALALPQPWTLAHRSRLSNLWAGSAWSEGWGWGGFSSRFCHLPQHT